MSGDPYRIQPLRSATAPVDPVLAAIRAEREKEIRFNVQAAPPPEQVARVTQVARRAGVAPALVDGRTDAVERTLNIREMTETLAKAPVIGKFFADNPRAAIMAQDDSKSLGAIADALAARNAAKARFDSLKNPSNQQWSEASQAFSAAVARYNRLSLDYRAGKADGTWERLKVSFLRGMMNLQGGMEESFAGLPTKAPVTDGMRQTSRALRQDLLATSPIRGAATWQDVKRSPNLSNVASFVGVQGAGSLPSMAMAGANPAFLTGSMTGQIGNQRAVADGRTEATGKDLAIAAPFAVASSLLDRFGLDAIMRPAGRTAFGRVMQATITEAGTEAVQSGLEYTGGSAGTKEGFSGAAAFDQMLAGGVAGAGMAGTMRGSVETLGATKRRAGAYIEKALQAADAADDGAVLDTLAGAAAGSNLRKRDPEAFKAMLDRLTDDLVDDKLYIPADKVQEFMQSPGFEESDFWRDHADDIAAADAMGSDFVVPVSEALTHLAGTPAWDALRSDIRMSPGGMSRAEAAAQEGSDSQGPDFAKAADDEQAGPRSALFGSAYGKLVDAGFTPNTARIMADVMAQRYVARSSRMGKPLTGTEFDRVNVVQVLPEKVRQAAKADATDLVINALRKGGPASVQTGPSLIEWIVARGGINDKGGDLKAIGLDRWHKEKPFRKRAIRDFDPAAAFGGVSGSGDYGTDTTLSAAIEAGYFPELSGVQQSSYADLHDSQILVDAISNELAGNHRYAGEPDVDAMREAADELRSALEEAGHDPDAMSDRDIRDFVTAHSGAPAEWRAYRSGERGRISFAKDGRATIQLFRSRNLSTFLHEAGHLYLEELKADAKDKDAPDQVKADWKALEAWFAANGHAVKGGKIPTEAHELFARGFERYLMEGKAPSSALSKAFETIRSWLVGIYRRVENLKAPVTDEVRQVMDRLLATDEEISATREEQRLDPVFGDALQAGMTPAEFDAYMQLVASAKSTAHSELLERSLRSLKARQTAQYREWEAEARAQVSASVDARPHFKALTAVNGRPLSRKWIMERFGADAPSLMPAGVPPTVKDGGAHPQTIAESVGIATGQELVETLMGLEKQRKEMRAAGDKRSVRQATIDAETQEVMAERYGDPFATGQVEEEALAAVHNDLQGEVIAAEVRAISRRISRRPTPYSVAREWARRHVREGQVREHASRSAIQQYRRAAAKNAKAAFEAIAAGNFAGAFRFKQAQLVNNALVREARDAAQEVEAAIARLDRIGSRKKLAGVEQSYLEQAHALLEQVDLKRRSGKQVDRQRSFEAWANDREGEGHTIAVPKSFAASIGQTNWTKLSAIDLLGLDDAVKQILHLGRLKQTLMDRQEEREHDAVVGEALDTINRLDPRAVKSMEDPTRWEDIKGGVLGAHASLLKMETVFKRLDGGRHGTFNRVVFQPLAKAQADEQALMREFLDELDGHLRKLPKATVARWDDQIEVGSLYDPRTRLPVTGPRSKLISMALNMGNESNAKKLAGGYGWREDEILRVLDRELTADEWRYVQSVWDTIERLWPRIAELERRVNGIVPDKVRPRVLNTSAGVLRGGYFPVVYDPTRSRSAGEHVGKESSKLFENNYTRASTSRGFTKERTEVERPVLLSLDVVNRHLAEVIHDLTHREVIMQADRFLSDKRVLDAVDETMGKDVSGLFRPWLQFIANEWSYDRSGVGKLEAFMRGARRNATFVGMAYRIGTMLAQFGGYVNSVERIGPKWMAAGLNITLRNPVAANAFAVERSFELRTRFDQLDRDVRENARRFAGKTDVASLVRRYAYSGVSIFDRLVSVPTWIGAYNKAIAAGMDEAAAVHEADAAVRGSQGAGGAKDLAAIQRGRGPSGELGKALTMFYSFQSANYNRLTELGWDAGDAVRSRNAAMIPELAARGLMLTVIAPVLSAIISGQGPDEDEEEGWADWALKQSLYGIAAPIPFLRDVVPVVAKKATGEKSFPYRFSPLQGIGESLDRVAGDINRMREGEDTKRATRNALEAAGYLTGLVPGQAAASAQFLVDVISGDVEPEGAAEWWQGATKGKVEQ